MSDRSFDRVDEIVNQYLRYLTDGKTPPSLYHIPERERVEVNAIMRILEASWGSDAVEIPPLEFDPLAVELGLVAAAPAIVSLSGPAIKAARKRSGKGLRAVVDQLVAQGFTIDATWVFNLEQVEVTDVASSLASGLARLLDAPLTEIQAAAPSPGRSPLQSFLKSRRFMQAIERWAHVHGVEVPRLRTWAEGQLMAGAYRTKGMPTDEEWERLLNTLFETWDE